MNIFELILWKLSKRYRIKKWPKLQEKAKKILDELATIFDRLNEIHNLEACTNEKED